MLTLIKNAEIYSPDYFGTKDILIAGDKIAYIAERIEKPTTYFPAEVVDADGFYVVPGFIDSHVHILGGGGEGGFRTRTPEIRLTDITAAGVTTVVGCLGTDGFTRSLASLLAKARALDEEGVSTYLYTGSYQIPVTTLTGRIETDLIYIDKFIGVGEVAMSDHRSSQPTVEDFSKLAGAARVAGMLSGKAGIVNIHMGDGKRMLSFLEEIIAATELPYSQFLPTHIGRNPDLFEAGIKYARNGGFIDLTTSTTKEFLEEGEYKCSRALKTLLDRGVSISQISFSSDGQGSLPLFDDKGAFKGLTVGTCASLFKEVRDAVLEEGFELSTALPVITANPARLLKLPGKGHVLEGYDADIVFLDKKNLSIDTVISRGKVMVQFGEPRIHGTFA